MSIQNLQSALKNAVSLHQTIRPAALGKDAHAEWVKLVDAVAEPAYALFSVTHDAAGRPAAIIDEEAARTARHNLAEALRPIVAAVGNVSFANHEGEAPLEMNSAFTTTFSNVGWEFGWVYSAEVKTIRDSIAAKKSALNVANQWLAYYELGDNEEEKSARRAAVTALKSELEALNAQRKTAEALPNGKVWAVCPRDMANKEAAFRKDFEALLYSVIAQQNKASYADYQAKKAAEKAAKRARQAERKAAKEEIAAKKSAK